MQRDGELIAQFQVRQLHQGGVEDDALRISDFGNGLRRDAFEFYSFASGRSKKHCVCEKSSA
jgi:hypothetical protein